MSKTIRTVNQLVDKNILLKEGKGRGTDYKIK